MFRCGAGTAPSAPGRSVSPAISLLFVSFESGFLALYLSKYRNWARLWKSRQSGKELENSSKDNKLTWAGVAGPGAFFRQMTLDRFHFSDYPIETMLLPIPHPPITPTFQLQAHLRCTHINAPIIYEPICRRLSFKPRKTLALFSFHCLARL